MITLYQFPPGFGLPNASPFCMKVETYLRMAGLDFRLDNRGQLLKAPKGKLPFIDDDGELIADSQAIIAHLERKHGVGLDAALDEEQRATSTAFIRLLEDNFYWAVLYTRWFSAEGWPLTREVFFGGMPFPLRHLVPLLARHGMRKQLHGHGIGRHSEAEIMAIGCADVVALSDFLGAKDFFCGAMPTTLDASAYAFLANLIWVPIDSPIKQQALQRPNLEAYCQRMRDRYYAASPV